MKKLSEIKRGHIIKIMAPIDCACRLRSMGICEEDFVEIINDPNCDPLILKSGRTSIAICKALAEYIIIDEEKL